MTAPVLHPVPPPASLTGQQLTVLALAIADAIAHRTPSGFCEDCIESGNGECPGHAADLDRTDDYLRLAADLGIDLEATEAGLGES